MADKIEWHPNGTPRPWSYKGFHVRKCDWRKGWVIEFENAPITCATKSEARGFITAYVNGAAWAVNEVNRIRSQVEF